MDGDKNVDHATLVPKLSDNRKPMQLVGGGLRSGHAKWKHQAASSIAARNYSSSYAGSLPYLPENQFRKFCEIMADVDYEARTTHWAGKATCYVAQPRTASTRPLFVQVRRRAKGEEPI